MRGAKNKPINTKSRAGAPAALVLLALSAPLMLLLCAFGSAYLTPGEVVSGALYRYFGVGARVGNHGAIVNLRLMRTALAYIAGVALSASGVCMQSAFRNPMADPHLLGVSSGAALGAAIATVYQLDKTPLGAGALTACAFLGAVLAVGVVLFVSRVNGRAGTVGLLLAGVAMSAFLSALLSGLLAVNHDKAERVYMWTMGSFAYASWRGIALAGGVTAVCCAALLLMARDMNVLLTGDQDAAALGVNVSRTRLLMLGISTLMTACVVSMSGVIGFVGLMVPHAARRFTGPDHRRLLPVAMLAGGIYMMGMDTCARALFAAEMPVGVLTALLGGPFFLFLLRRERGKDAC